MTLLEWNIQAMQAVAELRRDQRLAGALLVDAIKDVKARQEPEFGDALDWLSDSDYGVMSLRMVCAILDVRLWRIQKLLVRLLGEE